ncbi:MAG TPA: hypothetical protein VL049_22190, partial [Candidatus Dormibacteraeota bacterium]|nr:hypothetical protein [Candidatus Dormibacteraeota bacterium]
MERAQVIALAVIVAALALFGIGYVVDDNALQARDGVVAGALGDRSRPGIGLSNREIESRRGAPRSGPGGQPPEQRRGRRAGQADDDSEVGSAEVIAGLRRGASGLGRSGSSVGDDEVGANGI